MKLEMTLPEKPGLLHAVPILNLFALLIFIFLLGPSLVLQSGVAVELPPSRFQMQRYEDTLVVTLGPGEPLPRIHFGRDPVTISELSSRLDSLQEAGATAKSIVLLQTDTNTSVGVEREVTELVLAKGFRLAMVGKNAAQPRSTVPKTTP
jgi:biopolymer transport protein ExbD